MAEPQNGAGRSACPRLARLPGCLHQQRREPRLSSPDHGAPDWVPKVARDADQLVLLVLDGLGWQQLRARPHLAPTLSSASGIERPITSVAPTTTATALTSLTTGCSPSEHGVLGYRMAADGEILNVLRWTVGSRQWARRPPPHAGATPPTTPAIPELGASGAGGVKGRVRWDRLHRRPSRERPAPRLQGALVAPGGGRPIGPCR